MAWILISRELPMRENREGRRVPVGGTADPPQQTDGTGFRRLKALSLSRENNNNKKKPGSCLGGFAYLLRLAPPRCGPASYSEAWGCVLLCLWLARRAPLGGWVTCGDNPMGCLPFFPGGAQVRPLPWEWGVGLGIAVLGCLFISWDSVSGARSR